ncbi:hypothetical protein DP117_06960 [Brasilonema sp. UFV-L1]|nr:hypothetical protein [Brasilonema sp. UFV-L1]
MKVGLPVSRPNALAWTSPPLIEGGDFHDQVNFNLLHQNLPQFVLSLFLLIRWISIIIIIWINVRTGNSSRLHPRCFGFHSFLSKVLVLFKCLTDNFRFLGVGSNQVLY